MVVSIDKREVSGMTVVAVRGRVGEMEAQAMQQAFLDVFNSGCYQIIADFTDVDFMTSSGLGVLMMCMKRTREHGGFIRIANPQPLIRHILETTRLHYFMELFDSVDDALAGQSHPDA